MADCLDKDFYESLEPAQPRVDDLPPKPKAGVPYIGVIVDIGSDKTKDGTDIVKVEFDIHDGESAGYYTQDMEDRSQRWAAENWSYDATMTFFKDNNYQMKLLKGLIGNVEKSNVGFSFVVGNCDLEALKGKIVGIAFKDRKYPDKKTGQDVYALTIARTYSTSEFKDGTAKLPKSTKPIENDMVDNSASGTEPDIPF